jgi:hypothetical protein
VGEASTDLEVQSRRDQLLSCFKEDSRIMRAINELPPEYHLKDEAELGKLFRKTPMDYAMKKQLWTKFYEVEKAGTMRLKMVDIYGGVCSDPYFYNELIKNPARIAWLISPPIDNQAIIEEAYHFAFQKVRDGILNMPVTEKSAPTILKAFQMLADRHLGPVVQRIESKNLNVDVNAKNNTDPIDPKAIEEKLNELKTKLLNPAPIKDVTPVSDDE